MESAPTALAQRPEDATRKAASYWSGFALTYQALGSPLIPIDEELRAMEQAIGDWAELRAHESIRALLLGVTPNLARMRWPDGAFLLAVDRSEAMVRGVWPGDVPSKRRALCGDWLRLPAGDGACDVIVGDGSINCLRYPQGFRAFAASVRRVLRDDGLFVLRCFAQPEPQESPYKVMEEIGSCTSFHQFKLRLMMALQPSSSHGIPVNDVYRFWMSHKPDIDALCARTGWRRQDVDTIEMHNGPNTVHTFPTLAEVCNVLSPYFREISVRIPTYSLGDRSPLFVLKP